MTKYEGLPYAAEAAVLLFMHKLHPEIERQEIRTHVNAALYVLHTSLTTVGSLNLSGAIGEEVGVVYGAYLQ